MNREEFNHIVNTRLELTRAVLISKNDAYNPGEDRLASFKTAARFATTPTTPEQALVGMWRKHLISVMDMVDSLDRGILPEQDLIDEKIGDSINYLILLEALFNERHRALAGRDRTDGSKEAAQKFMDQAILETLTKDQVMFGAPHVKFDPENFGVTTLPGPVHQPV